MYIKIYENIDTFEIWCLEDWIDVTTAELLACHRACTCQREAVPKESIQYHSSRAFWSQGAFRLDAYSTAGLPGESAT